MVIIFDFSTLESLPKLLTLLIKLTKCHTILSGGVHLLLVSSGVISHFHPQCILIRLIQHSLLLLQLPFIMDLTHIIIIIVCKALIIQILVTIPIIMIIMSIAAAILS
jgi:hypothetical protein